jgi:hypothetical protein
MRAFTSSQTAGGIPKLRAAARACGLICCGATSQSPAGIPVGGARHAGVGPMGRGCAADPATGVPECCSPTASRRGLRGGRASDPPGSIPKDRPLRPARLILALDGLDDPSGGIPNHLAASLSRGKRRRHTRQQQGREKHRLHNGVDHERRVFIRSFAVSQPCSFVFLPAIPFLLKP